MIIDIHCRMLSISKLSSPSCCFSPIWFYSSSATRCTNEERLCAGSSPPGSVSMTLENCLPAHITALTVCGVTARAGVFS